ncbi:hypothetical protein D9611_014895 [Ephemerocybe angulata]|uniref:Uncharacterized protein n=1 Tax=Ephemerocybe angulata TaxID=980116 RepID=A0A8H5B7V3_9AGAR|nr:hypothetical protein D9611_014895 [Tulosesus angulatus]
MRLNSILAPIPLAISLISSALASHHTTNTNSAREYYDIDDTSIFTRRDILAELTTRDLLSELSERLDVELERRFKWRCHKCNQEGTTAKDGSTLENLD